MSTKQKKSPKELAALVVDAIELAIPTARAMPPFVEAHLRDGMGRSWDIAMRAPTPLHRKAIDSVRDAYDIEE